MWEMTKRTVLLLLLAIMLPTGCDVTAADFEKWRNREGSEDKFLEWMFDPDSSNEVRARAIEMFFEQYDCVGCSGAQSLPQVAELPAELRDQAILDALPHIRALYDGFEYGLGTEQMFVLDSVKVRDGSIMLYRVTDNPTVQEALLEQIIYPWLSDRYETCPETEEEDPDCRVGALRHYDPCTTSIGRHPNSRIFTMVGQARGLVVLTDVIARDPIDSIYCQSTYLQEITWYAGIAEEVSTAYTQRLDSNPPSDAAGVRTLVQAALVIPDSPILKEWIFTQLSLPDAERSFPLYRDIVDVFWEYVGAVATADDADHYVQFINDYGGALRWNAFSNVVRLRGAEGLELALNTLAALPAETDFGFIDGASRDDGYKRAVDWLCQRDTLFELGEAARPIYEARIRDENLAIRSFAIRCLGWVGTEATIELFDAMLRDMRRDDPIVVPSWSAEEGENTIRFLVEEATERIRNPPVEEEPDEDSEGTEGDGEESEDTEEAE